MFYKSLTALNKFSLQVSEENLYQTSTCHATFFIQSLLNTITFTGLLIGGNVVYEKKKILLSISFRIHTDERYCTRFCIFYQKQIY